MTLLFLLLQLPLDLDFFYDRVDRPRSPALRLGLHCAARCPSASLSADLRRRLRLRKNHHQTRCGHVSCTCARMHRCSLLHCIFSYSTFTAGQNANNGVQARWELSFSLKGALPVSRQCGARSQEQSLQAPMSLLYSRIFTRPRLFGRGTKPKARTS